MKGKAAIGAGPEEPQSYSTSEHVSSDMGTGIGRTVYQPVIELSSGEYVSDTEALQMFNLLSSLPYAKVRDIAQQLGIDLDGIPGSTKYEKLINIMTIVRYSKLRNELRKIINDNSYLDGDGGETNVEEQSLSLSKLKNIFDIEAERTVKLKVWIFVGVSILLWVLIISLIWRLGWGVMEPWTYAIGIPILIVQYLYFAITQHEISPRIIYERLLENEKKKRYLHYGLRVNELEKV